MISVYCNNCREISVIHITGGDLDTDLMEVECPTCSATGFLQIEPEPDEL